MERNVEDMFLSLKPRGKAAKLDMMLEQQDGVPGCGQPVCAGQPTKPAPYDYTVILRLKILQPSYRHFASICLLSL